MHMSSFLIRYYYYHLDDVASVSGHQSQPPLLPLPSQVDIIYFRSKMECKFSDFKSIVHGLENKGGGELNKLK